MPWEWGTGVSVAWLWVAEGWAVPWGVQVIPWPALHYQLPARSTCGQATRALGEQSLNPRLAKVLPESIVGQSFSSLGLYIVGKCIHCFMGGAHTQEASCSVQGTALRDAIQDEESCLLPPKLQRRRLAFLVSYYGACMMGYYGAY